MTPWKLLVNVPPLAPMAASELKVNVVASAGANSEAPFT